MSGPCAVCGATGYSPSFGGPSICPSCDCGVSPEVARLRREIADARAEIIRLTAFVERIRAETREQQEEPLAALQELVRVKKDRNNHWPLSEWLITWNNAWFRAENALRGASK